MNSSVLAALPPVMDPRQHADALVPTIAFGVVGVCTFAVYIMMLRRQLIEKVPAIPVLALCANISWEITYAFIYPIYPQMRVTLYFWIPLNLVILFLAVRYGRRDFPSLSRRAYGWLIAGWALFALTFMPLATREFDDRLGVYTTVFVVVFMDAAFVVMLWNRRSTIGQTMYIAILKMVVDVSGAVGLIVWFPDRWLLHQMIAAEVVLDALYIVLLYQRFRAEGVSPWRKI
ncbi:hypothetical protein O7634_28850 [Micromonospora sp. WMMD1120]|uniref:transmembrane-type terpene cyclase n=1 Tax=Micromonospora sp. WMMD1120 TaxID=3016106 RepID=UPI002415E715|nr:hypothetical protein [Micromonospora sp. WMMD1120]MDG4810784.1 hypothetical protein [Micromonospora sp. WMMD1120]